MVLLTTVVVMVDMLSVLSLTVVVVDPSLSMLGLLWSLVRVCVVVVHT